MKQKFLDFNLRNLTRKERVIEGGADDSLLTQDQTVGLKPQKGWARRNVKFIGSRLVPTILKQRERSFIGRPVYTDLEHHEIEVTWIGHASFLIRTPELNIMIDPNWAMWHGPVKRARHPGMALMDLPSIDLVLVTHAHFDHLHRPSLKRIANGQPILVPNGVGRLMKRMNFSMIREMNNWDTFRVGDTEIVFTPAYHWGLSFWGLLHMIGGLLPIPDTWPQNTEIGMGGVVYNLWLIPEKLKYDQVIHAYGFGITTWLCWQALSSSHVTEHNATLRPTLGLLTLCAAAG